MLGWSLLLLSGQSRHTAVGQVQSSPEDCHNCILIAKALESELIKIEPPSASQPLFGQRRLSHPRSEVQLFEKIDQVCGLVAELEPALASSCHSLMENHREALEELVYSEGPSRLRYRLCTELAKVCKPHALHDSGEL
ncbi:hypothetical protein WJX73_000631 [Symbiochloris irregularis]|uniref:Saposin B-type domain-containing protein n=1 Tax=Symbiochloris irregularis TaxID=706552 RepID=A0AAW1PML2_9CHLO